MKSIIPFAIDLLALAEQLPTGARCFPAALTWGHQITCVSVHPQELDYNSPVTDLKSLDTRCNAGGQTGNATETITMSAGDPFTINRDVAVYHQGPFSIYMAKAPAAVVDFDGSGQVWFKILDLGPTFSGGSMTWPLSNTYSYNVPKNLPSGDYLLHFEQLGIHNPYPAGTPQLCIECAQMTVINGGTDTPGPLVSIPGWVKRDEPGYTVNIYNGLTNYTTPGPAVWANQGTGSSVAAPQTAATQAVAPTAATTAIGAVVQKYWQCGGTNYVGSTNCVAGTTCKASGSYYSQCV